MSTPQGMLEGQYVTQPLYFKGQHDIRWKNQIENYIQADKEEMIMFTQKFKKAKENSKKKNSGKPKNSDQEQPTRCFEYELKQNQSRNSNREQFSGCFKCGKLDHIVKYCPQRKKEQEVESPKKQGRKQAGNRSGRLFCKAILATWGNSTEEEEETEEEEAAIALMAKVTRNQMKSLLMA